MPPADRLGALRERNRDLLVRLKLQGEKLERLSGGRERDEEAQERRRAGDTATGPASAGITARSAEARERQADTQCPVSTLSSCSINRGMIAQHADPSDIFKDSERLKETRPHSTKSCLVNHSRELREEQRRVTFEYDEYEEIPASDRYHLQPLLGYDWIAGVLDAEDSLIEQSDEFFSNLRMFQLLHKDECVSPQMEFSEENHSQLPLLTDKDDPQANTDTHQCMFSYRINSRLFPVPLHSQECCPMCKKHKSSHPHTTTEPALIRVSIPRSILLPPYKYKAHRRCSFDPSDSLGLPSHCLSGWSHTGQSTLLPPSSLDLRSSLNVKSSIGSQNKELEALSLPKVSANQIADQIPNLSQLARHNFQYLSPHKKIGGTS